MPITETRLLYVVTVRGACFWVLVVPFVDDVQYFVYPARYNQGPTGS